MFWLFWQLVGVFIGLVAVATVATWCVYLPLAVVQEWFIARAAARDSRQPQVKQPPNLDLVGHEPQT